MYPLEIVLMVNHNLIVFNKILLNTSAVVSKKKIKKLVIRNSQSYNFYYHEYLVTLNFFKTTLRVFNAL